jgi:7,8-dihydroneopterin aldolase/epimerase/oxygenase
MGKIAIEGMRFYAFHGLLKEEQIIGGNYIVDVYLDASIEKASENDDIKSTIDYSQVFMLVSAQMQISSRLIEHVAKRIVDAIKESIKGIEGIEVRVTKLNPPVDGTIEKVSVLLHEKY